MSVNAIIIIGHSNSGKTPLGQTIQHCGVPENPWFATRCHHLDFGRQLREIAAGTHDARFSQHDRDYIRSVLDGTLFDDAHLPLGLRIIDKFCCSRGFNHKTDLLVLNGFPRHIGQARGLFDAGFLVRAIIWLDCPVTEAYHRKILAEMGIGHENRSDRKDNIESIFRKKIDSFERRTLPLVSYYSELSVPIIRLRVSRDTTPNQMHELLIRELK